MQEDRRVPIRTLGVSRIAGVEDRHLFEEGGVAECLKVLEVCVALLVHLHNHGVATILAAQLRRLRGLLPRQSREDLGHEQRHLVLAVPTHLPGAEISLLFLDLGSHRLEFVLAAPLVVLQGSICNATTSVCRRVMAGGRGEEIGGVDQNLSHR